MYNRKHDAVDYFINIHLIQLWQKMVYNFMYLTMCTEVRKALCQHNFLSKL